MNIQQKQEIARYFYKEFIRVHRIESEFNDKIVDLNALLTKLFFIFTKDENIQFTTMFARIAFVCHQYKIKRAVQWRIHQLRKKKSKTQQGFKFDEKEYRKALKTACFVVAAFCQLPVPDELKYLFPDKDDDTERVRLNVKQNLAYLRVMVLDINPQKEYLLCQSYDQPGDTINVKYNETSFNENYNNTIRIIREVFQSRVSVNLLNVRVSEDGTYYPKAIVIEPDFLIDVTSVAECFSGGTVLTLSYVLRRFLPYKPTVPLMLGNIANFFLDELMTDARVGFMDTFKKVFSTNPIGFVQFEDRDIREIAQKSQKHFSTLRQVLTKVFPQRKIEAENCILEPSFYSEKYGLQGRLDVLYTDPTGTASIVELKSGKPFMPNRFGMSHNHYIQTILYDLVVRSVFGENANPAKYILYSQLDTDQLKFAPTYKMQQDEAINVRNRLMGLERQFSTLDDKPYDQMNFLDAMKPERFPKLKGFVARDLEAFSVTLERASNVERRYFLSYVSFLAREHHLARTGVEGNESLNGLASLWLNEPEEKEASFELLGHLMVKENRAADADPRLVFERTDKTNKLANFRQGDIVVLYPRFHDNDNVLTNQNFKGSVHAINNQEVSVMLYTRQFNTEVFEQEVFWFMEHDMMDSSYRAQYKSLYAFLNAPSAKRQLLLTTKPPRQPEPQAPLIYNNPQLSDDQKVILQKALTSPDYFLLVGPPGTGKTKFMLAEMVHWLLKNTKERILLMAYTNRAVDEICEAIDEFARKEYLRIGSRSSTSPAFLERLLSVQTENVQNRKELRALFENHRIFTATVAAVVHNPAILDIAPFDRVIIDEASQILEPMMVGVLPRFKRFVMIGDHKQLPAVVMQDKEQSAEGDPVLQHIGLNNRRNSLFERLYGQAKRNKWEWAYDMLKHQGRMHQDISAFPAKYFYNNKLMLLPNAIKDPTTHWQCAPLSYRLTSDVSPLVKFLATRRVTYFHTPKDVENTVKTNIHEAELVARLVHEFRRLYESNGKPYTANTIGVITPFRAQIAQIRAVLEDQYDGKQAYESDLELADCTIDTVERYQGGAREVIIISLCLNTPFQMETVVSLSDDGRVDRKLNVALTRARQHLVIVGNEELMLTDKIYNWLINWIEDEDGRWEGGEIPALETSVTDIQD